MKYPQFTGWEPCAQTDPVLFHSEDDLEKTDLGVSYDAARVVCTDCPMLADCREWGITHERYGFWGGLSPREREQERRRRGVFVDDPTARRYVRHVAHSTVA